MPPRSGAIFFPEKEKAIHFKNNLNRKSKAARLEAKATIL